MCRLLTRDPYRRTRNTGLIWENFGFDAPSQVSPDGNYCGYGLAQNGVFNSYGDPGWVTGQLYKCLWEPLSMTVNMA